ncbi:MAG: tRNA adenosine(34) deaminase TadA [Thiotrichaceae bacterium]|nr:tRNA adenosine(34) deaminase TadA [Thiotrichaceae bacterium]
MGVDKEYAQHEDYIRQALMLAQKARAMGEVPVGALVVKDGTIIGEGWNQPIQQHDPSAHAEMIAIRAAAQHLENYRIPDTTLYVTLEPCPMCVGLMIHARIKRLVFAAYDSKIKAINEPSSLFNDQRHNHQIEVIGGVLKNECSHDLKTFFQERRAIAKQNR